jgi:transposase
MGTWTDLDIGIMRKMLKDGKSSTEIGKVLDKSPTTVRSYVQRKKSDLNLIAGSIQGRSQKPEDLYDEEVFEKEWAGSIPHLHWAITKSWKV